MKIILNLKYILQISSSGMAASLFLVSVAFFLEVGHANRFHLSFISLNVQNMLISF